jgi:hypothetical protein
VIKEMEADKNYFDFVESNDQLQSVFIVKDVSLCGSSVMKNGFKLQFFTKTKNQFEIP